MRRRLFVLVAFLGALLIYAGVGYGAEYPKSAGFVNDFAHILPQETVRNLETELGAYERATSIEITVVTVPSLNDLPIEEYVQNLSQVWGVGKRGKDNGVILLVAPHERKMRIQTGYGLEPYLTDGEAGRIIREKLVPAFKKQDYAGGILAGTHAIIEKLGKMPYDEREHGVTVRDATRQDSSGGHWPRGLIILMVIGVVLLLIFLVSVSDEGGGGDGFFFSGGGFSGGFGGSSGGDSGGGGFGGFGGGGFGGGGASGSW